MTEPPRQTASLDLRLFGPLQVLVQGQPLPRFRSRKPLWLLALLTLRHDRPVERSLVAGLLWPESSESQAYANLRNALTDLRNALGSQARRLTSPTRHTLCLDLSGARVDVTAFDHALASGKAVSLEQVITPYRGPLLEGCQEEWVFAERQHREQAYLKALEQLAEQALTNGKPALAAEYLRRALAVDSLRESLHQALMQALAAAGDYAAATQVYRELRLQLYREMHSEPSSETCALYQQIQTRSRQPVCAQHEHAVPSKLLPPTPRPSLPRPLTALIGRQQEREQIKARLACERLVTLTGTGGVGKTRLAIRVAEEVAADYPDGVWFVELASLSEASLVAQTVASVLGVKEQAGQPLLQTLASYLQSRSQLLVLDNCEHLLAGCASLVERLLQASAGLKVLATSRQALGLLGETAYRVPSLPVPDARELQAEGKDWRALLLDYGASQLFVERAYQAESGFQVTTETAVIIGQICSLLDGIPLAIELAAARVCVLTLEQIASRLDDRFHLLTGGSRNAPSRQQTLRATLDWSYDLLTEAEKALLHRLSVFAGGWSLEAAERICSGAPIAEGEVLDLLTGLRDRSLVAVNIQGEVARYWLLETVRQYAQEKLGKRGEEALLQDRHQDYFLEVAVEAESKLQGSEQKWWLERLEIEHDNLRTALATCKEAEDGAEAGLCLAHAVFGFRGVRGYAKEARRDLLEALGREGAMVKTKVRIQALNAAGSSALNQGDFEAARPFFEEALRTSRELGITIDIACSLRHLGNIASGQGDYITARSLFEQALEVAHEAGGKHTIGATLADLGNMALCQGDYEAARSLYEKGTAIFREERDEQCISWMLECLGGVASAQGNFREARALYTQSLALQKALLDKGRIMLLLAAFARLALAEGQPERVGRLWGAAEAIRKTTDVPMVPYLQAEHERCLAALRSTLAEEAFTSAWEQGQAMTMEQAIAYALEEEQQLATLEDS
ncbi:MAG TPA: tetratricopeptide repeat protein [Chthonomonadaceae bacterium]|nr:tetratricopeptide repeat protein [Chthonomonadaceae bacterium]